MFHPNPSIFLSFSYLVDSTHFCPVALVPTSIHSPYWKLGSSWHFIILFCYHQIFSGPGGVTQRVLPILPSTFSLSPFFFPTWIPLFWAPPHIFDRRGYQIVRRRPQFPITGSRGGECHWGLSWEFWDWVEGPGVREEGSVGGKWRPNVQESYQARGMLLIIPPFFRFWAGGSCKNTLNLRLDETYKNGWMRIGNCKIKWNSARNFETRIV